MTKRGWHPIATAPTTGVKIDLWIVGIKTANGYRVPDAYWGTGAGVGNELDWVIDTFEGRQAVLDDADAATHWRYPPDGPDVNRGPHTPAQEAMKARIESMMTAAGGFSRESLAALGVPWPPPQGWKKRLIREAK